MTRNNDLHSHHETVCVTLEEYRQIAVGTPFLDLSSDVILEIEATECGIDAYQTGSALCSPVPMFPGTYVPRYLCSPVPMFPGTYVPRYRCSPIFLL